ncbi:MAG TPA: hypothetical protein VFX33_01095 [Actinomycetales bacterium]|jgi:hypothetical protein|nr:hypothetical protein [Actinomycetales bacterium]
MSLLAKAGLVTAAATTALIAATPAFAVQTSSGPLAPGAQTCASQQAGYQVRVEGTASKPLHFRVFRNGVAIQSFPGSTAFASELRTSWGNFPGSGLYMVCAVNNTTVKNNATVTIRTDGELG